MTNPLLPWEELGQQVQSTVEAATGVDLPDVFPTSQSAPTATPTAVPTATPTQTAPRTDEQILAATSVSEAVGEALRDAMAEALPAVKAQVFNYAKEQLKAELTGEQLGIPTVTVTNVRGEELKIADAKSRSLRTFVQGLGVDIAFALVAIIGVLANFNPLDKASWATLGVLVLKTVIQAVVSYVSRIKITPTARVDGDTVKLVPLPATSVTTINAPTYP